MMKFINNNAISSSIKQSVFFLNKIFHLCMSFNSDSIEYEITYVKLEANKAKNIFKHMKQLLAVIKQTLKRIRVIMKKQADKH
jgi:hypothetical protein